LENQETALPVADASAEVSGQPVAELLETQTEQTDGQQEAEPKPEKSEAERERARMQRGIDRKTRQAAEARAEATQLRRELDHLRQSAGSSNNEPQDDEPVTLSRAELAQRVKSEAEKLAPTLTQQRKDEEHRRGIVATLEKDLGVERFDDLAFDLDKALGGLADRSGRPKPATDAIFEADDPRAVIEFLADEENEADAEALARMTPSQAGRFIARLEDRLAATKAKDKPKASKAAAPIEPVRGQGGTTNSMPDPANTKAWIDWRNKQERSGI
jgi:DNA repair ATPase RecN